MIYLKLGSADECLPLGSIEKRKNNLDPEEATRF